MCLYHVSVSCQLDGRDAVHIMLVGVVGCVVLLVMAIKREVKLVSVSCVSLTGEMQYILCWWE